MTGKSYLCGMRILMVLAGSFSALLLAQSRAAWGGAGWGFVGYTQIGGYARFREAIQPAGLSLPSSTSGVEVGGGGGGYLRRVFIGGTGSYYAGGAVSGGAGFGVVGYFWRFRERWILMPLVGVGGGGYTFFVRGRPAEAPFDQATTGGGLPPRSFSTRGVLGNGAVVLQYFSTKGFMLGLQGGYEQALSSLREWSAAGISLQGGPSVQPQRFYVRLLLGGGVLSPPQN